MKKYELLSLNGGIMKMLHKNGIKTSDYKYLEIYEKYLAMLKNGYKKTYIVLCLSTDTGICARTIYRILDFLEDTAVL